MSKQARINGSRTSQPPPRRPDRPGPGMVRRGSGIRWGIAAAILAGAIVLAAAVTQSKRSVPASARVSSGPAPAFSERDVLTGSPVTSAGLRGHNVLLFFSEGVMCQACFEQIQSLQQRASELRSHGLTLINITTDSPEVLRQAVQEYHITTPMISDQEGTMSTAYGALGQGMHPNTDGHTFVLLDRAGRIRWRRDYTTMYVPPNQLFTAIPNIG
jgi:peroxiredoxin